MGAVHRAASLVTTVTTSSKGSGDVQIVVVRLAEAPECYAPCFENTLDRLLTDGNVRLIVDLGSASDVHSSTLESLLAAGRRARSKGGEIRVVSGDPFIRWSLRVTLLDRVLSLSTSLTDAIAASLRGTPGRTLELA